MLLDPDNRLPTTVGFLVLVGALVYLALRVGEWWMRHFIVTNRRVLLTSGIIVRTLALLPLRRITDLTDRKSTRLNSSHANISYAVFCLEKKSSAIRRRIRLSTS